MSAGSKEDLTLNEKITKVISDIKRLNQLKAREFGCTLESDTTAKTYQTTTNSRASYKSADRTTKIKKEDKLIEFIKREKRREESLS